MEGGFFPSEEIRTGGDADDDSILLPLQRDEVCLYCGSVPLCAEIWKCFGLRVCNECRRRKMRFVTKTRCNTHYLLTNEELKQFRCMLRSNPHRGSWNDMQLYIEDEVRSFSLQKHGSAEGLEHARDSREAKSRDMKVAKIKKQVKSLKQKIFIKPRSAPHRHHFVAAGKQGRCECGMVVDMEEL